MCNLEGVYNEVSDDRVETLLLVYWGDVFALYPCI